MFLLLRCTFILIVLLLVGSETSLGQINQNLVFGVDERIKLGYIGTDFTWSQEVLSSRFTTEGSSAISDFKGNLLLYTNGVELYDASDRLLADGLKSEYSTTQSSLLLRDPRAKGSFVLISNNDDGLYWTGLFRNKADGSWVVSQKNVPIYKNNLRFVGEKFCAIPSGNGGYWLITHIAETNNFVVIKFTATGFSGERVFTVGPSHTAHRGLSAGNLTPSPNGRFLVACDFEGGHVYLYQFNIEVGELCYLGGYISQRPYSACFSSDSKYIYLVPRRGVELPDELYFGLVSNFPRDIRSTDYFKERDSRVIAVTTYYDDMLLLSTYDSMYAVKNASTPESLLIEPINKMPSIILNLPNMLHSVFSTDSSDVWDDVLCNDSFSTVKPEFPKFFSPNRDDYNRTFEMVNKGLFVSEYLSEFELKVYNRWGQLVHASKDLEWDGNVGRRPAAPGTYFYLLEPLNTQRREDIHKGSVILMR